MVLRSLKTLACDVKIASKKVYNFGPQKRIEEERDGVLWCCITHKDIKTNDFSKLNLLQVQIS
jgi:hypothetical protein